jgi:hypothetical protein
VTDPSQLEELQEVVQEAPVQQSCVSHYRGPRVQDLRTPRAFFDQLHNRFRFTLDGAASHDNALLSWAGERVFCNPPWSEIAKFIVLGPSAEFACFLVPARTNARWFHQALNLGGRVEFFLGRPKFEGGNCKGGSSLVDCLLILFGKERP